MFTRWIESSISSKRSVLVLGPRRAGKTTLLKKLFPDFRYVTLDDLDALAWARKDPKGLVMSIGPRGIIDEIQRVPELTIAVKYAIDQKDAVIMMTGSSSIGLLDSTADTMAGRIDILNLPTACWGENDGPATHGLLNDKPPLPELMNAARMFEDAATYGQFPEVLTQSDPGQKERVLKNYRDTYFTRDLMQLANLENVEALLTIMNHLARSTGSTLDVSNFAREANVSFPTAKKYLNTLMQSQLVFKLYGYQDGPAKRYIKSAKTYFADAGIVQGLNAKLSFGQRVENFVLAELEKRRKIGRIPADRFFFYKSISGHEIDLVFEIDETVYAVEIKAAEKPGPRDIRNLTEFSRQTQAKCELILFYLGTEYRTVDTVRLIPIAALYRAGGL